MVITFIRNLRQSSLYIITSSHLKRHLLVLAQQAWSLYDIALGRLGLGISPNYQFIIEVSMAYYRQRRQPTCANI